MYLFPNSNIGYPCLRASPDTALADRHRPEPLGHRRQDGPATAAETDATTSTGTIIILHDRLLLEKKGVKLLFNIMAVLPPRDHTALK